MSPGGNLDEKCLQIMRVLRVLPQKQGLLRPLSSMDRETEALAWLGRRGGGRAMS